MKKYQVTSYEMPSAVDSAAIAGVVDILHTQGCFALSIRYAICLGLSTSRIGEEVDLPAHMDYARLAQVRKADVTMRIFSCSLLLATI